MKHGGINADREYDAWPHDNFSVKSRLRVVRSCRALSIAQREISDDKYLGMIHFLVTTQLCNFLIAN